MRFQKVNEDGLLAESFLSEDGFERKGAWCILRSPVKHQENPVKANKDFQRAGWVCLKF